MSDKPQPTLVDTADLDPFGRKWIYGQTVDHQHVVAIADSYTREPDGAGLGALIVASCPAREFAEYIAHFHNTLLQGARILGQEVPEFLDGYAARFGTQPPDRRPEETGGYL